VSTGYYFGRWPLYYIANNRVIQMVPEGFRQRTRDIRGVANRASLSVVIAHHPCADQPVGRHVRVRRLQQTRPRQTSDIVVGHVAVRRQRVPAKTSECSNVTRFPCKIIISVPAVLTLVRRHV